MEIWDVYNINREPTGKTIKRGEKVEDGMYHIVVGICVFNSDGKMLIQQRQHDKIGWPNMWDITAAGSAVKGETSMEAAHRELLEEVGLDVDFADKRPILTVNFARGFSDYYCVEMDTDLDKIKLQDEEVQAVRWADRETIIKMIDDDKFIPYYKSPDICFF